MTVSEMASALDLTPVSLGDTQREVTGGPAFVGHGPRAVR